MRLRGRWGLWLLLLGMSLWAGPVEAGGEVVWSWRAGEPTSAVLALPDGGSFALQVERGRWQLASRPIPDAMPDAAPLRRIDLGVMRGVPIQRLEVRPYRLDAKGELQVLESLTVTMALPPAPPLPPPSSPLLQALRRVVLDPEWVVERPTVRPASATSAPLSPTLQFTLPARGLYAVPLSALAALTEAVAPEQVHWFHGDGRPMTATYDAATAHFLLYAEPQPTRWADYEAYRVSYGGVAAEAVPRDGAPGSLETGTLFAELFAEENHLYVPRYPALHDGDHWYWQRLFRPGTEADATFEAVLTLATPATDGPEAELRLWLQGETLGTHRLTVEWAGHALGEVVWSNQTATETVLTFPASWLTAGENRLRVVLEESSFDGVWVDAVALRYPVAAAEGPILVEGEATPHAYALGGWEAAPLVWDVTEPDDPHPLSDTLFSSGVVRFGDGAEGGRRYFLTASATSFAGALQPLRTMTEPSQADYVAVLPADWLPTLQPLLDRREAEGLTTFAAPLGAIYDTYGDGRPSPEAIRAFVDHAYHDWAAPPDYLLLVGDGTYDPLHHSGNTTPDILPPYLAFFDPWQGEAAADNRYVTVDGSDRLPDLSVGRLPANDPDELAAMVAKILAYAVPDPEPGDWSQRHLFVADDPDWAGDFPADAATVMAEVPVTQTATLLRCEDEDALQSDCLNVAELHTQLLNLWNGGALLINWVGHSSQMQWEHWRLFHTDDLPSLRNAGRLPVVVEMTCYTGDYVEPSPLMRGMAESLLRLPEAGAVADWSPSGGGVGSDHLVLHRAFYRAAFGGEAWLPPGVAATAAKVAVGGGTEDYLLDGYHFFGDPAMPWQSAVTPWPVRLYLPLVMQGQ